MPQELEHVKVNRRQLILRLAMTAGVAAGGWPLAAAAKRSGFRAVAVNHISYQANDYTKIRDFYADLLDMRVSHDDGKKCYLTFGQTFLIARNRRRPDIEAPLIDHIAYTIANWNKQAVEAELRRRGLNPRPDTDNSFHVKDPEGFDLQIAGKEMRPAFWSEPATTIVGTERAAAAKGSFKAIAVNHISYQTSDYARTRDFYADLFEMQVSHDYGEQCWMAFGDTFMIPRHSNRPEIKAPLIDHVAYTIEKWDRRAVAAELERRGLEPQPDTEDSFIVKDPEGFSLQISGQNMRP